MAYTGKSPKLKRVRYVPQAADPVNPQEGDLFYSDGTPRAEGLWYYKNGAWQVVIADNAVITRLTMDNIVLVPQASDPGTPDTGEIFYSNGTSRAVGLWVYNGTGWQQISRLRAQEFKYNQVGTVRTCTSGSDITIATALNNGDTLNGLTLVNGDTVLVKDQIVTSQNGVYVVSSSPQRSTAYDTAAEVDKAVVYVYEGSTGARQYYFQNLPITTLGSDPQTWGSSQNVQTFTVPDDVHELMVYGIGGGGAGGGGGTGNLTNNGGGNAGGGGSGSWLTGPIPLKVTPGNSLTITLGAGGVGGAPGARTGSGHNGSDGTAGTPSTVSGGDDGFILSFAPGLGGGGGPTSGPFINPGAGPGTTFSTNFQWIVGAGNGGTLGVTNSHGNGGGLDGGSTMFGDGGRGGLAAAGFSGAATGGGGGAGGYGGIGGQGGDASPAIGGVNTQGRAGVGYGAGGGGGTAADVNSTLGPTAGGFGGNGYVRIVW